MLCLVWIYEEEKQIGIWKNLYRFFQIQIQIFQIQIQMFRFFLHFPFKSNLKNLNSDFSDSDSESEKIWISIWKIWKSEYQFEKIWIWIWKIWIQNSQSQIVFIIKILPVEPHEAVPEVSKGKVHITQNKHVPIEWFVTTASQARIWLKLLSDDSNKVCLLCRSAQLHATTSCRSQFATTCGSSYVLQSSTSKTRLDYFLTIRLSAFSRQISDY